MLLISCLSFVRSSKPTLSTTLKNFPPDVCLKAMKNKEKTREQKIAERLAYNQQAQSVN